MTEQAATLDKLLPFISARLGMCQTPGALVDPPVGPFIEA